MSHFCNLFFCMIPWNVWKFLNRCWARIPDCCGISRCSLDVIPETWWHGLRRLSLPGFWRMSAGIASWFSPIRPLKQAGNLRGRIQKDACSKSCLSWNMSLWFLVRPEKSAWPCAYGGINSLNGWQKQERRRMEQKRLTQEPSSIWLWAFQHPFVNTLITGVFFSFEPL